MGELNEDLRGKDKHKNLIQNESNVGNTTKHTLTYSQVVKNSSVFDIKQKKTAFFSDKHGIILFGVETRLLRGEK